MTTDDQTQQERLEAKLDRALELLEDLATARVVVKSCDEVHPEYGTYHPGGHPEPEEGPARQDGKQTPGEAWTEFRRVIDEDEPDDILGAALAIPGLWADEDTSEQEA